MSKIPHPIILKNSFANTRKTLILFLFKIPQISNFCYFLRKFDTMQVVFKLFEKFNLGLGLFLYANLVFAQDVSNISGVDDMLIAGQSMLKVAAKWGGIATVVVSALALGSGRLEGAFAQTICKILVVIGLLAAAMSFFGDKISWGFTF